MLQYFAILALLPLMTTLAFPAAIIHTEDLSKRKILPREAERIALDEVNNHLIAFDGHGNNLGKYHVEASPHVEKRGSDDVPTCLAMTIPDIGEIPGIERLRKYADDHFGSSKWNEVVNDDTKATRKLVANICSASEPGLVLYDSEPACTTSNSTMHGKLPDGFIVLEHSEGVSMSSSFTVTRTSMFGIAQEIAASVTIPEIAKLSTKFTTTFQYTNSQSTASSIGRDLRSVQHIRQLANNGYDCSVTLTSHSCTTVGHAKIAVTAKGWLWFEYEKPVGHDKKDQHYKWAVNMDHVLPKEDDRSSYTEFRVAGTTDVSGHFFAEGCVEPNTGVATKSYLTERQLPSSTEYVPSPNTTPWY